MRGEGRDEEQAERARAQEQRVAERLLVLALLRGDHVEHWSKAELRVELTGIPAQVIEVALQGLAASGVVCTEAGSVSAAPPTRSLDDLDMICI